MPIPQCRGVPRPHSTPPHTKKNVVLPRFFLCIPKSEILINNVLYKADRASEAAVDDVSQINKATKKAQVA